MGRRMLRWGSLFIFGLAVIAGAGAWTPVRAASLQYPKDCKVGMRVKDHGGQTGTVTRFDASWSYCYVRMDGSGSVVGYLYSLLEPAGGGNAPAASGLPAGVYECYGNGDAVQAPVRIIGPGKYSLGGSAGGFSLKGSKIVWASGPLKGYTGKLLSGGRIGIGDTAEDFYPTSCDLNRTLR
jgi:hypothetical protein